MTYHDGDIVNFEGVTQMMYKGHFCTIPDNIDNPDEMMEYCKMSTQRV